MGWRVVIVSNTAKLDYKMGYLCVRTKDEIKRIFIDEISVLIIETPSISLTSYLLIELANNNVNVIFCDHKRTPHGLYHSLYGSHDTSRKIRQQVKWSDDIKGLTWQRIVASKIKGQSSVLMHNKLIDSSNKLLSYLPQVEISDKTNREGHAAKVYFNALFGKEFSRERNDDSDIINSELNYGYSVLLSVIAREIVANGYLTQIGIFHDNVFNEFNLASDLMEPFRPFVDQRVIATKKDVFDSEAKAELVGFLNCKVMIDNREQYLLNATTIYVKSVLDSLSNDDYMMIKFPEYDMSLYESNRIL